MTASGLGLFELCCSRGHLHCCVYSAFPLWAGPGWAGVLSKESKRKVCSEFLGCFCGAELGRPSVHWLRWLRPSPRVFKALLGKLSLQSLRCHQAHGTEGPHSQEALPRCRLTLPRAHCFQSWPKDNCTGLLILSLCLYAWEKVLK